MKLYEQIVKKLDMQISHCKDCQDTDGQLKGFIEGLKKAKLIVMDCQYNHGQPFESEIAEMSETVEVDG